MTLRRLGPFSVPPIGLGCMNLSHGYAPPVPQAEPERLLLTAVDAGVTLFDTAALYGFGANETLVGRVLKPWRNRIVLCSKGGMTGQPVGPGGALQRVIDGRPEAIRRDCEDSLRRLGTDVIDVYYLHRLDRQVPVEETVGAMSRLVEAGKVRCIGLSEVGAVTLRRAHAVHPVIELQNEYAPWTREPEIALLQACRDLGVALVAFSPLGRGFLADALPDAAAVQGLTPNDMRRNMPRFQAPHLAANLHCLAGWRALARDAGITPAQLALAWVMSRGNDVIPIPGTTRVEHLLDNMATATLNLDPTVIERADRLVSNGTMQGGRYPDSTMPEIDTERFAL